MLIGILSWAGRHPAVRWRFAINIEISEMCKGGKHQSLEKISPHETGFDATGDDHGVLELFAEHSEGVDSNL